MNYLLTKTPCMEFNSKHKLYKDVWYKLNGVLGECLFLFDQCLPVSVNFEDIKGFGSHPCFLHFNFSGNNYFVLNPKPICDNSGASFKYQNKNVVVCVSKNLNITIDGTTVLEMQVDGLKYSQFQIFKNHLCIYFAGKRNFVVVIKESMICIADFYDEINLSDDEAYFMKRLYDSINHGKVFNITEKGFDSYLVYLDNYDLNLKDELLPHVMLDLIKAKNYNYASNLLSEELKPTVADEIGEFFPDFDEFYAVGENQFCLIKNDTSVGIVKFETSNCKIVNIIIL